MMASIMMADPESSGSNFRIIPGKQKGSKIYVKEPFTYVMDRSCKGRGATPGSVYLKCRFPSCLARAIVSNGFLSTSVSRNGHTCNESESVGMSRITVLELTSKMKLRAELETTSFYVSIYCAIML